MKTLFEKNLTFTAASIANELIASTQKYQDFSSARSAVNQAINKLGIQSINGQRRNRYFTGLDAQKVFDYLTDTTQLPLLEITEEKTEEVTPVHLPLTNPDLVKVKYISATNEPMVTFNTFNGCIDILPEEIAMITMPPLRYYLTFRGWGSILTLKSGRRIHVKADIRDVRKMIQSRKF